MTVQQLPEQILDAALAALSTDANWMAVLDALPAPIYVADAEGAVTYWNRACADFAGREPQLGRDRWCIMWKVYTATGEPMAHDQSPMAQAMRQQRVIRDTVAIAERPDGSRRAFRPYPTPLFDKAGVMTGAINMLIDVTDEQAEALHEQAERCRRLAGALYSRESSIVLENMAERFEHSAAELERRRDG